MRIDPNTMRDGVRLATDDELRRVAEALADALAEDNFAPTVDALNLIAEVFALEPDKLEPVAVAPRENPWSTW